jgi:predicted phosphodiesterase
VLLLCLSDVHGRADALAAVLATAERRGYDRLLVAGDLCFPGPSPLASWRRLQQLGAICVQGVGDRALATVDPSKLRARDEFERARLERLVETQAELGEVILAQLAALPPLQRLTLPGGGELVLVHGAPGDPLEPITHDMDDEAVAVALGASPPALVLCGGSHVPFDRLVPASGAPGAAADAMVRVVGLGSVGEAPGVDPSGRRYADGTWVSCTPDGIEVEHFIVPLGHVA